MNATCFYRYRFQIFARSLSFSSARRISIHAGISLAMLAMAAILLLVVGCGGGSPPPGSTTAPSPPSPPSPMPPPVGATGPEYCTESGNILPAGDVNTDLQISGVACKVDGSAPGGNYVYRNVNIYGGGSLTFSDTKINFHAHSILIENGGTMEAGFDEPLAGPLSIWLYGSKDDGIPSITCVSTNCGVPQKIWDSNPLVATNVANGTMVMPSAPCTLASTADPTVLSPVGTDCFYQYEVFEPGDAPGAFFGKKVLAVSYGGSLLLRGKKGIREATANGLAIDATPSDSSTSWVRLTENISAGTTSFHVDRPVPTWVAGDQIVVTSTDYLPGHSEQLTISGISTDSMGTKIGVSSSTSSNPVAGTQFPHWGEAYDYSGFPATTGPRDDPNGPTTRASRHLENRAAVALLTRSIMIQSEGQNPVLQDRNTKNPSTDPHFPVVAGGSYYGGHTLVRDGFAEFQVQGVEFANLGQGGKIGHYPVHFHMARTVPPPTTVPPFAGTYLADSSIHDSNTRFVTIHATQGLLVARNVGYRSIGHGYYLEDATEINNRLYSNIGIQSLAAVYSDQNISSVPGILSQTGNSEQEVLPFHSDYDHPSIFWIMNTWNDFQYNVAVGAGTCGACYWTPPAFNSGYSVYETWQSYAAIQGPGTLTGAGSAPLMNFVGNSCSAAMLAFQTNGSTATCQGVTSSDVSTAGKLQAVPNPTPTPTASYPNVVGGGKRQQATVCDATTQNCNTIVPCNGSTNEGACAVTVLDHFSTSFNWAQLNDAAVLLRGWWYLLTDSSITDIQNGGLQMVTGGGYSRADVAQGFWNLSSHNLFVGNTQPIIPGTNDGGVPANPNASNAGPFNPYGLNSLSPAECPYGANGGSYCVSPSQGIAFEGAAFSNSQRLLNIYDGPTFEDSDAFADIHTLKVGTVKNCRRPGDNVGNPGVCNNLGWENAFNSGVLQYPAGNSTSSTTECVLPNAAISWKQPNGFYYPPSFDSRNLYFDTSVDIRHFVIDPLWGKNSFLPEMGAIQNTYCTWQPGDFSQFSDIDRQTELTDLDGSLTGLLSGTASGNEPTISVNNDPISDPTSAVYDPTVSSNFFNAPVITPECATNVPASPNVPMPTATVNTSPYEYVTTAVFPDCGGVGGSCTSTWGTSCTNQACYGVPLYRQYLTGPEMTAWNSDHTRYPNIRMQSQATGQRSNLTMNHGSYYIDSTVPLATQLGSNTGPDTKPIAYPNVFLAGHAYYIYVLYAKPSLHQTYSMYIGTGLSSAAGEGAVATGIVNPFPGTTPTFIAGNGSSPDWITAKTYDPTTGVVSVTIDLSQQTSVFNAAQSQFCQPTTYCSANSDGSCGCKAGTSCVAADSVCSWGPKEIDCPPAGCFGFSITLPASFQTATATQPIPPPAPVLFSNSGDPYFAPGNIQFSNVPESVAGSCYYSTPPTAQAKFARGLR